MISPDIILKDVLDQLNKYKDEIGITRAEEINEDGTGNLKAPYIGAWFDFSDDAEGLTSTGAVIQIPVEIKLLVCGAPAKTLRDASAQAFKIAFKAVEKIRGVYTVDGKRYILKLRSRPFDIWKKRKDSSMILINLYYQDNLA